MSAKRYFQLSYVWPIVLPVVVVLLPRGFVEDWIQQLCREVLNSGGFPYALFAGAMLLWSGSKEGSSVRRSTYLAPVLFLPALGMSLMIAAHRETYHPNLALAVVLYGMVLAIPVLILGYCYVGLVNLGFVTLRSLGAFGDDAIPEYAAFQSGDDYRGSGAVARQAHSDWPHGSMTQAGSAPGVAYSGGGSPTFGRSYMTGSPYGFAGWEDEKLKGASGPHPEVRVATSTASPHREGSHVATESATATSHSSRMGNAGQCSSVECSSESAGAGAAVNAAYSGWPRPRNDGPAGKKARGSKLLVGWDPLRAAALGLMAPLVVLSAFAMWRHAVNPHGHPLFVHQVRGSASNQAGTVHK